MGFKEVYLSLRDAFPQVDIRILKAVAIEHEKDADAAAEFIITEVLPSLDSLTDQSMSSTSSADEAQRQLLNEPSLIVNEKVSFVSVENLVNLDSRHLTSTEKEPVTSLHYEATTVDFGTSHVSSQDPEMSAIENASFSVPLTDAIHNVSNQTFHGVEEKEVQDIISHLGLVTSKSEENSAGISSSSHCFKQVTLEHEAHVVPDTCVPIQQFELSSDLNAVENRSISGKDSTSLSEICNVPTRSNLIDESEANNSSLMNVNVHQYSTVISTGSGQFLSIDFLEDLINDARSNKQTLLSAMECIVNLIKEVELRERDAREAKNEAVKAGMDILAKVNDLKKMLGHAKETSYMHSGEVYGEKSILATEARELQSRLLSLSGQRDESLSIIEEMRVTLEARLATAEAERVAAADERLVKEEKALQELHEQENIMDMVIRESKKLMHEAEENSRLRDFLMDRGRIVDTLQGEIAVVCEDILSLKDKIDRRVPFSSVLHSSQLTSSGSSLLSKHVSSPEATEQPASSSNILIQDLSERENAHDKSVTVERDPKEPLDDDWDLFEADAEVKSSQV